MNEGPNLASVAALLGDPARASMMTALMHGRAMTAGELGRAAGVTPQTASGHLARLREGGLVLAEHQGRHRYYRIAGIDVAEVVERLQGLAGRSAANARFGPRDPALREARLCYDHLAGTRGVALLDRLIGEGLIDPADGSLRLTPAGRQVMAGFGVDVAALETRRRPLCRACLDWSERRPHLAGSLGAALAERFLALGWLRHIAGSRTLLVTPTGRSGLARLGAERRAAG